MDKKKFQGERLKSARLLRGLTLAALQDLTGISNRSGADGTDDSQKDASCGGTGPVCAVRSRGGTDIPGRNGLRHRGRAWRQ